MRRGRFPLSRACRRLPTDFSTGQGYSIYIFGTVSLLRIKRLEHPHLKGEPTETGAWSTQNSIPHYRTATFRPLLLLRMRHNCRPSSLLSLVQTISLLFSGSFPDFCSNFPAVRTHQSQTSFGPRPSTAPSVNPSRISRTPLLPYARCAQTWASDAIVASAPTPAGASAGDR